jgi:hypothetical protein
MPMYTFYLCKPDGAPATFEIHEAHTDEDATARALSLLAQHPTCAYATVWQGEREVDRVNPL